MENPHSTCDGHTYEKDAICTWLRRNNTSPATNLPLTHLTITPNYALKKSIQTFLEMRPEIVKSKIEHADLEFAVKMREYNIFTKIKNHGNIVYGSFKFEMILCFVSICHLLGKSWLRKWTLTTARVAQKIAKGDSLRRFGSFLTISRRI